MNSRCAWSPVARVVREQQHKEGNAAADTLASTSDKAQSCATPDVSADSAACVKTLFDFYRAMTDMQAQFAAWGPYGV
jgi:hypothetical protein